jgi:hypothetical protein
MEALAKTGVEIESARMKLLLLPCLLIYSRDAAGPTTSNRPAPGLHSIYAAVDHLPNKGIIEATFDGEIIQLGNTHRSAYEWHQQLSPACTFHLTQVEKEGLQELRQIYRWCRRGQNTLEFEERKVRKLMSGHI